MLKKTLIIRPAEGLSPRVAARVVRHAQSCACRLECVTPSGQISMKSLMAVLSLGLGCGNAITIVADGEDEAAAMDAMEALQMKEKSDLWNFDWYRRWTRFTMAKRRRALSAC